MPAETWHEVTALWWGTALASLPDPLVAADALRQLHATNASQWRLEDRVREAPDHEVAQVKREIDAHNGRRHRLIEQVDEQLASAWMDRATGAPLTESIGSSLDRLSVLSLRIVHAAHAATAERRALAGQRDALLAAVDKNCRDLVHGVRSAADHRCFKRYGAAK
jgi:hypothetical protein